MFWPWFLALFANIGLDAYVSSEFFDDVLNTGSVLKFLKYLEVTNFEQLLDYLPDYSTHYTRIPGLIMMIVSLRLVIIFFANIWFLVILFIIYIEVTSEINKKRKLKKMENPPIALPDRDFSKRDAVQTNQQ